MSNLNRRDFLKVVGVTSTATVAACEYTDPRVPVENVLPYVVVPDQTIPGISTWFATACNECPSGCGVLARNREGRVVKLEGNPDHPTNRGNLCAKGISGIQATYSPDRYATPLKGGAATDWDTALKAVSDAITAAKSAGKEIAWLGSYRSGSLAALITQFMGALGGRQLHWEPLGLESLRAAVKSVFGVDAIPDYRLDGAHTILSFGADFLSTWLNPTSQTLGYANSRDRAKGGFVSKLVCVEPRVGSTSAMADIFLAAAPGSEAGVAMAIAKLLKERNGYAGPAAALVDGVDVAGAAAAANLSEDKLREVADLLAAGPSVVLPGGTTTSAAAYDLAVASLVINEIAGNVGKSLVFGPHHNTTGHSAWRDVSGLLKDAAAGKIGVLFLDGSDPVFNAPGDAGAKAALAGVDLVVAFANEPNDSLQANTMVLPPGTTLENWGDSEAIRGRHTLQQPAMRNLHDSRSVGDVLLTVATALGLTAPGATPAGTNTSVVPGAAPATPATGEVKGGEPVPMPPVATPLPGFEQKTYKDYLAAWWQAVVWPLAGSPGSAADFWTQCQQRGGYFHEIGAEGATCVLGAAPATVSAAPEGDGSVLVVFAHPTLYDGRHANKPWAQEVPESISTIAWGTWVEIHPDVAHELGLEKDDGVVLETAAGSIEVGWFGSPGIRKDTIAVVLGNGHENGGRYARYGKNPMALLATREDGGSGALSFVSTRAKVKRSGNPSPTFQAAGHIDQAGRGLSHTAFVGELETATGAGSAVHPHTLPIDERLLDPKWGLDPDGDGKPDMYPEPEHPTYRFAMAVDLNRCTGCGACQTACYSENNLPVVGPDQFRKSRSMGWIRLSRYWEGEGEHPDLRFQPVMCQQCSHAPCEGVCPVLATYHNLDGLNAMIYNRCVGTRYCANNCPYTARRFNFHTYGWPESFHLMLNPDVSVREMGVMEKCTFCSQRIREVKDTYRDQNHAVVPDSALQNLPACVQACPADAMVFGNLKDKEGMVYKAFQDPRAYIMLGELNTKSAVRYLARVTHTPPAAGHGGAHGGEH